MHNLQLHQKLFGTVLNTANVSNFPKNGEIDKLGEEGGILGFRNLPDHIYDLGLLSVNHELSSVFLHQLDI